MTQNLAPALPGSWFLILGTLLGPAIIYFEKDPAGHTGLWLLLTVIMAGLFVHRLSLKYVLDGEKIQTSSWWGLGRPETIKLAHLSKISVQSSFSAGLFGCGHIFLASRHPDEPSLILLAQKRPGELARHLTDLARTAGAVLNV
jgi:hypothetical protein